ncbi:hypothetical protein ACTFIU_003030 [Dictyostelium citrinum]
MLDNNQVEENCINNINNNNNNNNCNENSELKIQQQFDYCERSWKDLKEIIQGDRLEILGRKLKDQAEMEKHLKVVKQQFKSIKDYIDFKVFKFPTQSINYIDEKGIEVNRLITIRPENLEQKLVFRPNDFPYSCDKSISHWVLWCLKPLDHEDAKHLISKLTNREFSNDDNGFLFFINPFHLQSIKEISHYHVFIKDIDQNQLEFSI